MEKYRIGYTTGVFDLFHIGHLNLLEKAKRQCRYLIVGVSTDELAYEYKHKYPAIPFEERIKIVSMIRCVDEVMAQTSMDKLNIWKKIHFDVLFHGDDWKNSQMYMNYEKELNAVGVQIVYLPHTEGISSSKIRLVLEKGEG